MKLSAFIRIFAIDKLKNSDCFTRSIKRRQKKTQKGGNCVIPFM